ncbi:hypothetical protein N0V93_002196 [Gnomoniopsis smithogilvyi]|uniref:SMP-30/Gluconolactonase/LRE-like region domain-containing protein n=1 Tax=Gnomoniopsis smithogilvyi TaxID=1191159 RepID=A0A9W8YY64_9PEZI|nr:hypothetical protein N0V93_002196 [Gnomoniopsis smithogilvyi]
MPTTISATALLAAMGSSALAQSFTLSNPDLASFEVQDQSFMSILGGNASLTLIQNATEPLFHEGGVYIASADTLFLSSNRITLPAGQVDESTANQTIKLSAVKGVSSLDTSLITVSSLDTSTINLPNGGAAHVGGSGLLWTAQGSKTATSGIYSIPDPVNAPNVSVPIVTSFFGRQFNSPNDVVSNPKDGGSIWFTDPNYGSSQGLRNAPQLQTQVYRHDPATNTTRVLADDLQEPNGLAFNADFTILYVTDAAADAAANPGGAASIYAYDVLTTPGTFLANKRLFAFAPVGIPDGIKVDSKGNVWSGTGSGVVVWNSAGTMLGQIKVSGGAANFGFGATESTVFVLGEKLLWRAQLA